MTSSNEEVRSVNELLREIEELREKGDYYRNIIESADKGVWVIDDNGNTTYINYRMVAMLGYTIDEVTGESIFEYIDDDHRSSFKSRLAGCKADCAEPFDLKFLCKDGNVLWALAGLRPLSDKAGKSIGVNCTFVDITERKLMEMALRETRENLEKAQRVGKIGSWVRDCRTGKLEFSDELCHILGVQKKITSIEEIFNLILVDDKEDFMQLAKSGLKDRGSYKSDVRFVRADGRAIYCYVEASSARDMDDKVDKVVGVVQDITERKLAEKALAESEEKFRTLAEMSPVAIFFHRGEGFIYANPAALKIVDHSFEDILKMKFWDLFDPEYSHIVKERGLARLRGENPPQRYEVKLRTEGSEKWMDITSSRVIYKGKPAILVVGVDVTQARRAEAALREAKGNAEFFIDIISHDIGNMNQAVLGYLELAHDALPSESVSKEFIERPMEIIKKSSRLIRDVRMLRQIRSGMVEIKKVDAGEYLARTVEQYAAARDVQVNYSPVAKCYVMANEALCDAFSGILSDMAEFGKNGQVIDIHMDHIEEHGRPYCRVVFEDNGPGIPDELKKKLTSNTLVQNGMTVRRNLGTAFIKALVEAYRGKLWMEDRVSGDYRQGIRIVIQLPAA